MTRIPELEQELVAAAARLRSPRRVLRPTARAALAAAAVAVVVVFVVVEATDQNGADRRRQPAGTAPRREARHRRPGRGSVPPQRAAADGPPVPFAPPETQTGSRCADPRDMRRSLWPGRPRGRSAQRPRGAHAVLAGRPQAAALPPPARHLDEARWCRLEDPVVGHVAFVRFTGTAGQRGSAAQAVEWPPASGRACLPPPTPRLVSVLRLSPRAS